MADVQIDNGNYLRVHNDIYDALARTRVPGEARQIFDFIIRKTYGYNKKADRISLSQFIEATGIKDRPSVIRAIHRLEKMNMIGKKANNEGVTYWVNKNYDSWKPLAKKPTLANKPIIIGEKANRSLAKKPHTKDNYTKDKRQLRETADAVPAKRFLHDFGELFKERFGTTYFASFKKDTVLVKDLLKAFEYDDLVGRAKMFFRDTDEWIKKTGGYTIGSFKVRVNKYVMSKATVVKEWTPRPEMTTEQKEAAAKALREGIEQFKNRGRK